jgi:hypothetical protein
VTKVKNQPRTYSRLNGKSANMRWTPTGDHLHSRQHPPGTNPGAPSPQVQSLNFSRAQRAIIDLYFIQQSVE